MLSSKINRLINKETIGIDTFVLEARINEAMTYNADVVTHTLEDGSDAHDHIRLLPRKLEISGEVSDISLGGAEKNISDVVKSASDKARNTTNKVGLSLAQWTDKQLKKIESYIPQAEKILNDVNEYVNKAFSTAEKLQLVEKQDRLSVTSMFISHMESLYNSKTPFTVNALGRNYENMFMTSFTLTKRNEDNGLSYSMTLMEIKYAEITDITDLPIFGESGTGSELEPEKNKGIIEQAKERVENWIGSAGERFSGYMEKVGEYLEGARGYLQDNKNGDKNG